jgi:hypothetical protein
MLIHTLWIGEELPPLAYLSLESFVLTTMVKTYKYHSYHKDLINPINWWEEEKLFDWDIPHSTVAVHCWNSRLEHNKRNISKLCRTIKKIND